MKKLTMFVAGLTLVPLAAFGLSRQDQPEPAEEPSAQQADERDAQFASDVDADAAPAGCCWVLIHGRWICITGC
jgi:hypothetical protein